MSEFSPPELGRGIEGDFAVGIDEAVRALRALVLAAQGFRQGFANALGVTVSDTLAMSHLAAGGPLSARELAFRTGLAPSSITAMVDRLEHAGLATRTIRADNRRTLDIDLTERGRRALALSARWTRCAVAAVGHGRLPDLTRGLNELATSLRDEALAFTAATTNNELTEHLESHPHGQ
jgi:DNA-binding MarR family transcriptional regulator